MILPADFDAAEYLRLHRDVAAARLDAAYHYLKYGAAEGRPYKAKSEPLIFFVHVPKTAGSTVNDYLQQRLPSGRSHCEAFINGDRLSDIASTADWISGHVDLATASARLKTTTRRKVRFFSAVRSPVKQVVSHYNWLIEIAHRGRDFYNSHPAGIRAISEAIRSSGTDAASIAANLRRWPSLFLNMQSRYVLGHDFHATSEAQIRERLGIYEYVGLSDNISPLVEAISGAPASDERAMNSSRYHFNPDVFTTDELVDCLQASNQLDTLLYQIVANLRDR